MKRKYVRFVVGTNREKPTEQNGVVSSLRFIKEAGKLPDYEVQHAEEILRWLNSNLPCPPFSASKWPPDAISWFKASARGMIAKFRELISILEQYDEPVRMLTTNQPGVILYEDEFQIVAHSVHF